MQNKGCDNTPKEVDIYDHSCNYIYVPKGTGTCMDNDKVCELRHIGSKQASLDVIGEADDPSGVKRCNTGDDCEAAASGYVNAQYYSAVGGQDSTPPWASGNAVTTCSANPGVGHQVGLCLFATVKILEGMPRSGFGSL